MERCGKMNASNSSAESWTGIGVVAGCAAVMLITQGPLVKNMDVRWGITLRHILQEVRSICKTRNQLRVLFDIVTMKVSRCRGLSWWGSGQMCRSEQMAL